MNNSYPPLTPLKSEAHLSLLSMDTALRQYELERRDIVMAKSKGLSKKEQ